MEIYCKKVCQVVAFRVRRYYYYFLAVIYFHTRYSLFRSYLITVLKVVLAAEMLNKS